VSVDDHYLAALFHAHGRDPTDVELMMFAQAKLQLAQDIQCTVVIDGVAREPSLFGMIGHAVESALARRCFSRQLQPRSRVRPAARFYPNPTGGIAHIRKRRTSS
jgi:phosphoribosylformylglycinamidine synthase